MEYSLIFYTARKTAYCETALARAMEKSNILPKDVSAAVTVDDLGNMVNTALQHKDVLVVIGDTNRDDDNSLVTMASKGFCGGEVKFNAKKLSSPNAQIGYILNSGKKTVLLLPDSPDSIERLVDLRLTDYIKAAAKNENEKKTMGKTRTCRL